MTRARPAAGSTRLRCFVAVDPAPEVRAAIVAALGALRAAAPAADVRWTAPAGLHVTLKFLGTVAEDRVPAVEEALRAATAGSVAMALGAAGLGGFPSLHRPRVLWAGVGAGAAELARVAARVDAALEPLGFRAEARPFHAHVTLGRVRSTRGIEAVAAAIERAGRPEFGGWTAREIVLYRSLLRPQGALYVPLAHVPLGGVDP